MTDYQSKGTRITLKHARPNPLFQEWLENLLEEAKAKKSKLEPMLHEAITSLSKYPLPLESGAECAILKGFDKRLCKFLDNRLNIYNSWKCEPQGDTEEQSPSDEHPSSSDSTIPKKRARKTRNQNIHSDVVASENSNSESTSISNISNVIVIDDHDNSQPSIIGRNAKKAPPSQNTSESSVLSSKNDNIIHTFQDCSETHSQNAYVSSTNEDSSQRSAKGSKKTRKGRKEYKPLFRSGGYAILMALFEHQVENHIDSALNKEELINIAQKYSEESFIRPKPESFYTAWSNMSTLVTKGLVNNIRKKKSEYSLTDQGIVLATQLWEDTKNTPTVNDMIFNNASRPVHVANSVSENGATEIAPSVTSENITESQNLLEEITTFQFAKGSFEVILLIDKNETGGVSNKNDPTVAQFNKYPNLKHEYRSLKVGDFTWVIRHKVYTDQELVLPYIVERKRMDDLGASIKDGRFHEQKFRLRKCGLKNVIYLVESYGSNKHVGLPLQSLMQALANTRIQDGFKVQSTESLTHTARFLAMMTKRLTIEYEAKQLISGIEGSPPNSEILMTFNYFNKSSIKNKPLTVKEAFIKLLLQLKGVSVEKALAITNVYSTPKLLIKEYEKSSQKEGEKLLANLKYGDTNRNVGPSVSKAIHIFFTWNE